jgi:hypothetical protein
MKKPIEIKVSKCFTLHSTNSKEQSAFEWLLPHLIHLTGAPDLLDACPILWQLKHCGGRMGLGFLKLLTLWYNMFLSLRNTSVSVKGVCQSKCTGILRRQGELDHPCYWLAQLFHCFLQFGLVGWSGLGSGMLTSISEEQWTRMGC